MKKEFLSRIAIGLPIGITIGFIFSILISACIGDGFYHAAAPNLVQKANGELNAVIFQTILSAILGVGFAGASIVWEFDSWSIAKQTGVSFAANAAFMFPIAYIADWMPHTVKGVLSYTLVFIIIFIIIWLIQYLLYKNKVNELNRKIKTLK